MTTQNCLLIVIAFVALSFTSCTKATTNPNVDPNAKQHNEDVSNTKSESDNVNTDVNSAMNGITGFGKNGAINSFSICGAIIDSSHNHDPMPYITVTFDGTTVCPNPSRIRSGVIKVQLIAGAHWTDMGAVLKVTHTNYKVTFPSLNNHYLTFNGSKYLTNVNGINWVNIYFGTSTATIRERSYDMTVTFENGQTSTWKTARLSTWGINNFTEVYAIVNGDTTIAGKTIDSWGVTRFGTNFSTEMITPWKANSTCGWWRPTQGKYTSTTDNFSITAVFGTDASGNPQSSGCPSYFKLDWNINSGNVAGNAVIGYF